MTLRKRIFRAGAILAAILAVVLLLVLADAWTAIGSSATGARLEKVERSKQWSDGKFVNPQPLYNDILRSLTAMFDASPVVSPTATPPSMPGDRRRFEAPPATGLRVTWLGHSSVIVEVDGYRVLTDPVWSERASPLTWIGPRRYYAPAIPLQDLPPVDAVLISHDHYDHLDYQTITAIKDWDTTFVVPLGVGAHLVSWSVPESKIVELDWWESTRVRDLELVAVPSRHASGRFMMMDRTLWAGYAMIGPQHRAYYSGDTGLFPAMKEIGSRLGPFDVTLIEIGQYNQAWPDWHIGPEQAVTAHRWVNGRVLLPVHWGLFTLAAHGWTEPIERVLAEGAKTSETIVVPMPGQSIEPALPPELKRWWPELPWKTGAQDPIISTKVE